MIEMIACIARVKFVRCLLIHNTVKQIAAIRKTSEAPQPIGPYSQAIKSGNSVYLSGQIPLDPKTGKLVEGTITEQAQQVFKNLQAVAKAAGGDLSDIVNLVIFITDFSIFAEVNTVMGTFFKKPYPSRSTVAVKALPMNVPLEIQGTMILGSK